MRALSGPDVRTEVRIYYLEFDRRILHLSGSYVFNPQVQPALAGCPDFQRFVCA